MRQFELFEPRSLQQACAILASEPGAKAIAGGTALLTIIKQGLLLPKRVVNLKKISAANEIAYDSASGLRIGALATIDAIETSPLVRKHYPMLAEACHVVANVRIRNMATIGGNLAHGDHQSDPPTVLVALDARVELMHARATRQVKLCDFLLGSYETALEPGELISAVLVPPARDMTGHYSKFTTGSSGERPCAGVAALAQMDSGICRELRLAVGAISPRPIRIAAAEQLARDMILTDSLIDDISAEAARAVDPVEDLRGPAAYKRHLVGVLVRRSISAITAGKVERNS